jgi:hypothetical protein
VRPKLSRNLAVAGLLLVTQGCDRISRIDRRVDLPVTPTREQVESSLKAVRGVEKIEYARTSGDDGTLCDRYIYSGERFRSQYGDLGGVVEVRSVENGSCSLHIYLCWMNYTPSRKQSDLYREAMDQVYASLSQHLPGAPPASSVQERIIGFPGR